MPKNSNFIIRAEPSAILSLPKMQKCQNRYAVMHDFFLLTPPKIETTNQMRISQKVSVYFCRQECFEFWLANHLPSPPLFPNQICTTYFHCQHKGLTLKCVSENSQHGASKTGSYLHTTEELEK